MSDEISCFSGCGKLLPIHEHLACVKLADTGQHLRQLTLPISFHTCNSHDLPAPYSKINTSQCLGMAIVKRFQSGAGKDYFLLGLLFYISGHVRNIIPGHHPHNLILVSLRGFYMPADTAMSQNVNTMTDFQYLVQLVADKNNALPLAGHIADNMEQ